MENMKMLGGPEGGWGRALDPCLGIGLPLGVCLGRK